MNIQAHQTHITMLKREVQNAWIKACQADNIPLSTSFAVFSNTTEAAAYNELMGIYASRRIYSLGSTAVD